MERERELARIQAQKGGNLAQPDVGCCGRRSIAWPLLDYPLYIAQRIARAHILLGEYRATLAAASVCMLLARRTAEAISLRAHLQR